MIVASIDCGTNALRLLISADGVDVLRRLEIVRLGQGVDRTGYLDPAALERARVVLVDYAGQIAAAGATRVRLAATSATRDARNADDFRALVRATLGIEPEVISGIEEARLTYVGAVAGLPPGAYRVVDIGGGSTEFATADGGISLDIGSVRLTERHFHSDPPTAAQVAAATAEIEIALDRVPLGPATPGLESVVPGLTLVGVAGSVTTVAAIALGHGDLHQARVSAAQVEVVTAMLLAATHAQRLALPFMHPGRADIIAAGALILARTLARFQAPELLVSTHDILDGLAASLR